jgi:hypothetical protein
MSSPLVFDSQHYSVVTAMITPAFFLTATGSLLVSCNNRLARVVDRMRDQIGEWHASTEASERRRLADRIAMHRKRARMVLIALQLLYGAISAFVGTSLAIAMDQFLTYSLEGVPTGLALVGVLLLLAASLLLGREARIGVNMLDAEIRVESERDEGGPRR